MRRNFAVILAAVLATGGLAAAQDVPSAKPDFGTTMTLGGKGTAAQAAAADDTELTWCHRRWGWGCGWGGGCWGGGCCFRGVTFYSAPVCFTPVNWGCSWGPPIPYSVGFGGFNTFSYSRARFGGGFIVGINGTESDSSTPAVSLNLAVANNPLATRPAKLSGGTFRYDGGPANPVPLPKPDASPSSKAPVTATGLPVSLPKTATKSPYMYKAYGEK